MTDIKNPEENPQSRGMLNFEGPIYVGQFFQSLESRVVGIEQWRYSSGIETLQVEMKGINKELILGVKGQEHPLKMYMAEGVPVTLATDDEGTFHTSLTSEYVRAVKEHGLAYEELKKIARAGLEYSFLEGASIYSENGQIVKEAQDAIDKTISIAWSNAKAKSIMQVLLEQDFNTFEAKIIAKYKVK